MGKLGRGEGRRFCSGRLFWRWPLAVGLVWVGEYRAGCARASTARPLAFGEGGATSPYRGRLSPVLLTKGAALRENARHSGRPVMDVDRAFVSLCARKFVDRLFVTNIRIYECTNKRTDGSSAAPSSYESRRVPASSPLRAMVASSTIRSLRPELAAACATI
jgi:hypothetical protein